MKQSLERRIENVLIKRMDDGIFSDYPMMSEGELLNDKSKESFMRWLAWSALMHLDWSKQCFESPIYALNNKPLNIPYKSAEYCRSDVYLDNLITILVSDIIDKEEMSIPLSFSPEVDVKKYTGDSATEGVAPEFDIKIDGNKFLYKEILGYIFFRNILRESVMNGIVAIKQNDISPYVDQAYRLFKINHATARKYLFKNINEAMSKVDQISGLETIGVDIESKIGGKVYAINPQLRVLGNIDQTNTGIIGALLLMDIANIIIKHQEIIPDKSDIPKEVQDDLKEFDRQKMLTKQKVKFVWKGMIEDNLRDHKGISNTPSFPPDGKGMTYKYPKLKEAVERGIRFAPEDFNYRMHLAAEMEELISSDYKFPEATEEYLKTIIKAVWSQKIIEYIHVGHTVNRIDDYLSETNDCLSFGGKYETQGLSFLKEKNAAFIGITGHQLWYEEVSDESERPNEEVNALYTYNYGRLLTVKAKLENKHVLYVDGLSGQKNLDLLIGWEEQLTRAAIKYANIKKLDGILFNMNPLGSLGKGRFSHQYASYVAKFLGLEKDVDYTYERKEPKGIKFFRLKNPEWRFVELKRSTNDALLMEGLLVSPEEIRSPPTLIVNGGYCAGIYLSKENAKGLTPTNKS